MPMAGSSARTMSKIASARIATVVEAAIGIAAFVNQRNDRVHAQALQPLRLGVHRGCFRQEAQLRDPAGSDDAGGGLRSRRR